MTATAILDFRNREILLAIGMQRIGMHQHARVRQNWSIGCNDIKIFWFLNMAAAATLDCRIDQIILADGVWRAKTHHFTKYRQNRSFRCRDIAIFRIFKMAAATIWDFWNRAILLANGSRESRHIRHAKFCQNRSIGCEDIKIFRFIKMAAVRHLGFVWGTFGPPTVSTFGSLSLCKIWLWLIQYSFYNMNISICGAFGWKMPIYAPKLGFLDYLIP